MNFQTFLKLGRVSNLPTVWTNALAGAVLTGHTSIAIVLFLGVSLSFLYVGGMWLNDAFDAEIDARDRKDRPIPNGEVSERTVFMGGFAFLAAGVVCAFWLGFSAGLAGLCLAGVIVLYDWLHKRTILSPVIMGSARFFCYVVAALAVSGAVTGSVVLGALGLLLYTAGLTYAAKQEAYDRLDRAWPLGILAIPIVYALMQVSSFGTLVIWAGLVLVVLLALRRLFRRDKGDVPKAVVTLIAGISLYDATLIAATGQAMFAFVAVAGFFLTLALQRVVTGT
ncbi:MAG: UbiA family prenyltransferase [Sulfitobacter sp.]